MARVRPLSSASSGATVTAADISASEDDIKEPIGKY